MSGTYDESASQEETTDSFWEVRPRRPNGELSPNPTICTHMTSLTFDLTSDQGKLPRNRKNPFTGTKWRRNLQESNRGGSLSRMDRRIDVMCV